MGAGFEVFPGVCAGQLSGAPRVRTMARTNSIDFIQITLFSQ
jgi:hypothetical protein